jgi:hypothetical protein
MPLPEPEPEPPPAEATPVEPLPVEPPIPLRRGPKPPPKKRSSFGRVAAVLGWVLFVMVLGAVADAGYMSDRVMEEFPETKGTYAFLGFDIPPPGNGLRLSNVNSTRVTAEGVPALVVEGKITNTTSGRRIVPPLRGSLRDANDKELQAWTFSAAAPKLEGGESASFRTEVRQPSPQATGLSITFVGQ